MRAPDERVDGRWASEITASLPDRVTTAVREWIEREPQAPALVDPQVRWTYGELGEAIDATREWLERMGVRRGDRIMVVSENGRALVSLLLAAGDLDVWVAIINARLSGSEIDHIRDNCQPRRVLYTVEVSPAAREHAERNGAERITAPLIGELAVEPLADVEPAPVEAAGADQVAAMIYTSGTTGAPKGVMLTHRGVLFIARVSGGMRNLKPGKRVYGVLPTSHVFGLSSVCLGALANGACLYAVPRFDPAELVAALENEAINVLQGVPAMYARTLEYLKAQDHTLRADALEYTSAGGSPLDLDLKSRVEPVFGTTLHNGYGLTEASPTISQTRIGEHHDTITVGKVLPGLDYRLLDDNGQEVNHGAVGELWVRGPNLMKGYYRRPEATAEVLTEDGWLNTGDLARIDEHGNLFIVGRSKELIIRSGFNVYPPDVEAVLNEHPDVTLSAVVGRQVQDNEEVVAFIQPVPGSGLTAEALKAFAAERLSAYKRPTTIIFMETLPATATGKILKGKLRDQAAAGRSA
ncbi:acyl--CoA ligase [Ectothiorhodospiraceae bacterium WFHF3C12]|nr:acyl--CoA ligase [Ectothiorhodospiraceae bacterium WFHF3C12]